MSPDERKALLEAAEKAIPDDWGEPDFEDGSIEGVLNMVHHGNVNTVAQTGEQFSHAKLRYIALANPKAIRELIIDLQTAEFQRSVMETASEEAWKRAEAAEASLRWYEENTLPGRADEWRRRAEAAEASLATVRQEERERAAKVAEACDKPDCGVPGIQAIRTETCADVAAAIRALGEQP